MAANNKFLRYSNLLQKVTNWPSYLLFKAGLTTKNTFIFKMNNGFQIPVDRNMMGPFRECFFNDQYMFPFKKESIPDDPFILDIGSNVGFAALYFFYHFPNATVHSFEPMPFCIDRIHKYQQNFPTLKWVLHTYGLWSSHGTLELFTDTIDSFTTTSGILANSERQKKISVPVHPLSTFLENHVNAPIDLLKIDCEGAEYEILYTLDPKYFRQIRRIVVELHPHSTHTFPDIRQYIQQQGYEIVREEYTTHGMIWASQNAAL